MADATLLPLPVPRHALARPEHPALLAEQQVWTYGRLSAEADELALRLAANGLGVGQRLAVCVPNGLAFVALFHAAARLGAVLVPLNTRLTAEELAWQLADSDPALVVWAPELGDRLPALPGRAVLVASRSAAGTGGPLADAPALADLAPAPRDQPPPPDLAPAPRDQPPPPPDLAPDPWGHALSPPHAPETSAEWVPAPGQLLDAVPASAPAAIVYTSGTTGPPKGAVLTRGNMVWSAVATGLRLGVAADDQWLMPMPLFHIGGLAVLVRTSLAGTTVEVPGRFDPQHVARALASGDVSLASLVPTMLARVLDAWGDRTVPAKLRGILLGGGPVGVELLRRAGDVGLRVAPTYGLTEAASQVATASPSTLWPASDVGAAPLAFTSVRVADPAGRDCARGEVGEIWVRGPTVMAGYWNKPAATAEALVGGWLHTGDAGWLDGQGRVHVADRRGDLIVSGGENVYPVEVEAVLNGHPDVVESCVVGLPDPEWGQVVTAVIVRRTSDLAPDELVNYARRHLAGFKVPRRIVWSAGLPRTAAGKLQRATVRGGLTER